MRNLMVPLEHHQERTLDTCGTGGNGAHHLNLSTGAAIIAAAGGIPVAKHGNRAATSKCGSADVLEELGVNLEVSLNRQATLFNEQGLVFLYARNHHPAMKHVAVARKELGIRTLFNCLGPLANPARVNYQLLGAYSHELRPILAEVLNGLGVKRAWVVRSEEGMDEVSPSAPTHITQLDNGKLSELTLTPESFGFETAPSNAAQGGDAKQNAQALLSVLRNEAHPGRSAFLLNAAAAFCVRDELPPKEAGEKATKLVASGAAFEKLQTWIRASQQ